jgi:DNA-binding MarR family transcriptional regulator
MDLASLALALGTFATQDPTRFPLHHARLFLEVALNEPATFEHLEQALNLTNSSVSRSVAALSDRNRHGDRGYRLLTVERDPEEGRRFLVRLSPKGRLLLQQLQRI